MLLKHIVYVSTFNALGATGPVKDIFACSLNSGTNSGFIVGVAIFIGAAIFHVVRLIQGAIVLCFVVKIFERLFS